MDPGDTSEPRPGQEKGSDDDSARAALAAGAIYIRWGGNLWQEQADGTYRVWNDETRQWEDSARQPPSSGKSYATRECPSCGKRVRTTLRTCPHCGFDFPEPVRSPTPPPAAKPARAPKVERYRRRRHWSLGTFLAYAGIVLAGTLLVSAAVIYVLGSGERCSDWHETVASITDTAIELNGLPAGMTREQLLKQNEQIYSNQKPGGCE